VLGMLLRKDSLLTIWIILVLLTACSPASVDRLVGGPPLPDQAVKVNVARVVDGDTFVIDDGRKVRMIGINTPESVDPRRPVEYYGKEASRYAQSLIEGKDVYLLEGTTPKDRYGRLLAWVWLPDGTFVNGDMIYQGYAQVYTFADNPEYAEFLLTLQREAREAGRGLWGKEVPDDPHEKHAANDNDPANSNDTNTSKPKDGETNRSTINGLIIVASQHSKVYHEQGCPGTEKIASKNLIKFTSEQNAIESGRRMCKVSSCKWN
jgi:micrococcal nuclease